MTQESDPSPSITMATLLGCLFSDASSVVGPIFIRSFVPMMQDRWHFLSLSLNPAFIKHILCLSLFPCSSRDGLRCFLLFIHDRPAHDLLAASRDNKQRVDELRDYPQIKEERRPRVNRAFPSGKMYVHAASPSCKEGNNNKKKCFVREAEAPFTRCSINRSTGDVTPRVAS